MKRDETVYLRHILDSITKIETYLNGVQRRTFDTDTRTQDAVIRQLEIIGEAVKRLSSETRNLQPHIPWSAIAGMRDKLIHDYFRVDIDQVWLTANNELSALQTAVSTMLSHLQVKKQD
jgi:uncharacterized protein with HEPN domain